MKKEIAEDTDLRATGCENMIRKEPTQDHNIDDLW
jgi:hypothetical protein